MQWPIDHVSNRLEDAASHCLTVARIAPLYAMPTVLANLYTGFKGCDFIILCRYPHHLCDGTAVGPFCVDMYCVFSASSSTILASWCQTVKRLQSACG